MAPQPYLKAFSSSLGYRSPSLFCGRDFQREEVGRGASPHLCAACPWQLAAPFTCLAGNRGTFQRLSFVEFKCRPSLLAFWNISNRSSDTNASHNLSTLGREREGHCHPENGWCVHCYGIWKLLFILFFSTKLAGTSEADTEGMARS